MDIRKVKKLIELLEESNIDEIEIKEGEESVRISRNSAQSIALAAASAAPPVYTAPPPVAAPAPEPAPAPAPGPAEGGASGGSGTPGGARRGRGGTPEGVAFGPPEGQRSCADAAATAAPDLCIPGGGALGLNGLGGGAEAAMGCPAGSPTIGPGPGAINDALVVT